MKISVFGLGYVGAVTAGVLARHDHEVVGVDVQPAKVEALQKGLSPIVEPGLDALLQTAVARGLLRATNRCDEAIRATDVSIVCVGTPATLAGELDLNFIEQVVQEIAVALRRKRGAHHLILRSTMLPGSTERLVQAWLADLESAGRLQVYFYPEFMREGTALADYEDPALNVVGTRHGTPPAAELLSVFAGTKTFLRWPEAELLKFACNAFHATKIAFANEIGRLGKMEGIDARVLMELLCRDTRLNLSPVYLQPGNPFGGSCLPKDVRALATHSRQLGLDLPLVESLLPSNERHLEHLLALIERSGHDEVVLLGLAFKPDTDDLRGSAMVEVAQRVLRRGCTLRIFDPALNLAALVGSNKREIDLRMPHLASQLCPDLRTALGQRGLVVAAQKCADASELAQYLTPQHHVLDVNGWPELRHSPARYEGFCW